MPFTQLFFLTVLSIAASLVGYAFVGKPLAVAILFLAAFAIAIKNFTRLGKLDASALERWLLIKPAARSSCGPQVSE